MSDQAKTSPPSARRTAVGLQIKLPVASADELKGRYGAELAEATLFVRTRTPKPAGTFVRFDFRYAGGDSALRGLATVKEAHTEAENPQRPGMLLQFLGLDGPSHAVLREIGLPSTLPVLKAPTESMPAAPARPTVPSLPPAPRPTSSPSLPPQARPTSSPSLPPQARPTSSPSLPPQARPSSSPSLPPQARPTSSPSLPPPARPPPEVAPPVVTPVVATPVVPSEPAPESAKKSPPVDMLAFAGEDEAPPPPRVEAPPAPPATPTPSSVAAAAPLHHRTRGARVGPVVGIDLGTTNSCVAFLHHSKPQVIPSREGYNTVPSVFAINDRGKMLVGHPAKGQLLTNPRHTVYGAKRLIGRPFHSPVVAQLRERFPYEIVEGPRGEAAVSVGGKTFTLQEVSALILKEVREVARGKLGQDVTRAVITVPAYYNDLQRNAVREAGELAGLHVEQIVNEPTAAALAFGHGRNLEQRVLVYDLGGGTFDVSVLELKGGNVYEVVSTGGDTFLGGVDFDLRVLDVFLDRFEKSTGKPFDGDRVALQRMLDAAERAKMELSEKQEHHVLVPFVALDGDKPLNLDTIFTRQQLVETTSVLVDRTLQVTAEVLAARKLKPTDIDEVLLVGGQSRMPLVREKLRAFFGKEPHKGVHPDEAVALGAAVLAHSIGSEQIDSVVLIDVLPMSIGVGLPGGRFKKIIERNTTLPHTRTHTIATTKDGQTSLEIQVFQGEADRAVENEFLGSIKLDDLPKAARGSVKVDLTFKLTREATLAVVTREESTGAETLHQLATRDTPEEVRRKLADLEPPPPPRGGVFGFFRKLFGRRK